MPLLPSVLIKIELNIGLKQNACTEDFRTGIFTVPRICIRFPRLGYAGR